MDKIPVGYQALCTKLQLNTLPHYRASYIATRGRGKIIIDNSREIHIYPKSYALQNDDDLLGNLEFALKYDGVNLEIIKALFTRIDKAAITQYIQKQPTGIYSRKIWFLYEFLIHDSLDLPDCQGIKYIDVLDPKVYITSVPIKSPRHAVNDNLLGNREFCPLVRRTITVEKYIHLQLDVQANALLKKYNPQLIARACNYLFTKETMSSYQIEREQPSQQRIARFVTMLQRAPTIENLSKENLLELQSAIVDPRFRDFDYRHTQNYVGENITPYFQKIDYISPKPQDVLSLMQGLLASLNRMFTAEVHPVIIAAAIAFGFVFIHPFEDGNGRIHRFLIHYILSKKHFTPHDMIFPISSIMLQNMQDYDAILESFSKPLLTVLTQYDLSQVGIMHVSQETKDFYQYIDFTLMVEYLFQCIEEAILKHIEPEIKFLIHYDKTKKAMQEVVDMPDNKIDLLIRSVLQNNGNLSATKKNRFFSLLTDAEIQQLVKIIHDIMIKRNAK